MNKNILLIFLFLFVFQSAEAEDYSWLTKRWESRDGSCLIKGNISYKTGEKIYHIPGWKDYDDTKINTSYGERWFCTEWDAYQAGWRAPYYSGRPSIYPVPSGSRLQGGWLDKLHDINNEDAPSYSWNTVDDYIRTK